MTTAFYRRHSLQSLARLAVTLVLAFSPVVALAQEAPPPPPPVAAPQVEVEPGKTEADKLADEGREAYKAGNYAEAFKLFTRAYAAEPKPAFLYNMAKAKEKLADYKEAVHLLEKYLQIYKAQNGGAEPANASDVSHLIRDLKQRAFEALPEVVIASVPPGAQVIAAGEGLLGDSGSTIGTAPLTTHMEPGKYKLTLKLKDFSDLEADLVVPQSGKVNVVLSLKSRLKRAALSFWANVRGAQITVDGKVVAVTPYAGRIDVEPGPHQITLHRSSYKPIEREVTVPEDKILHSRFLLEPTMSAASWRGYLGWPLMIVGGLAIGGGATAAHYADLEYANSPNFNNLVKYQNAGYYGGGIAVGLGLFLAIWDGVRSAIPDEERIDGPVQENGSELRPLGTPGEGKP